MDSVHHAVFSECYPELPEKKLFDRRSWLRPGDLVKVARRIGLLTTLDFDIHAQRLVRSGDLLWRFHHELALTPSSLAQVLRATGFEVVSVQGFHGCPPTSGGKMRRAGFRLLNFLARWIIEARHGRSKTVTNLDLTTALPDITTLGFV